MSEVDPLMLLMRMKFDPKEQEGLELIPIPVRTAQLGALVVRSTSVGRVILMRPELDRGWPRGIEKVY